jgi:hypothetical protein
MTRKKNPRYFLAAEERSSQPKIVCSHPYPHPFSVPQKSLFVSSLTLSHVMRPLGVCIFSSPPKPEKFFVNRYSVGGDSSVTNYLFTLSPGSGNFFPLVRWVRSYGSIFFWIRARSSPDPDPNLFFTNIWHFSVQDQIKDLDFSYLLVTLRKKSI